MAKSDALAARTAPLELKGRPPPVHHAHRQWLRVETDEIEFKRIAAIRSSDIATAAARSP
jgi:hypothetical protein